MTINLDRIRSLLLQMVRYNPAVQDYETVNISMLPFDQVVDREERILRNYADLLFYSGLILRARPKSTGGDGFTAARDVFIPTKESGKLIFSALHDDRWEEISDALFRRLNSFEQKRMVGATQV